MAKSNLGRSGKGDKGGHSRKGGRPTLRFHKCKICNLTFRSSDDLTCHVNSNVHRLALNELPVTVLMTSAAYVHGYRENAIKTAK